MSASGSGDGVKADCFREGLRWRKEEACGVFVGQSASPFQDEVSCV